MCLLTAPDPRTPRHPLQKPCSLGRACSTTRTCGSPGARQWSAASPLVRHTPQWHSRLSARAPVATVPAAPPPPPPLAGAPGSPALRPPALVLRSSPRGGLPTTPRALATQPAPALAFHVSACTVLALWCNIKSAHRASCACTKSNFMRSTMDQLEQNPLPASIKTVLYGCLGLCSPMHCQAVQQHRDIYYTAIAHNTGTQDYPPNPPQTARAATESTCRAAPHGQHALVLCAREGGGHVAGARRRRAGRRGRRVADHLQAHRHQRPRAAQAVHGRLQAPAAPTPDRLQKSPLGSDLTYPLQTLKSSVMRFTTPAQRCAPRDVSRGVAAGVARRLLPAQRAAHGGRQR